MQNTKRNNIMSSSCVLLVLDDNKLDGTLTRARQSLYPKHISRFDTFSNSEVISSETCLFFLPPNQRVSKLSRRHTLREEGENGMPENAPDFSP